MTTKNNKPDISVFFPVYNDENTVRTVTEKALKVLTNIANNFEILIINDCSPDKSGEIADELTRENRNVKVIHHETNMGYGATLITDFNNVQ